MSAIPKLKQTLRFNKDGKFNILMISDFHAGNQFNPKLVTGIEALVKETNPDLVLVGGDQCLNKDSVDEMHDYLGEIMEPINSRNIPWAHVFGNHDNETKIPVSVQEEAYERFPNCVASAGPEEVSGTGNYVLPVLSSKDDTVAFNVWGLDSHREYTDYFEAFDMDPCVVKLPDTYAMGQNHAEPFFDQIMWYYQTSLAMEKENGKKIPAIMYMHVPVPEFVVVAKNPEECSMRGNMRELPGVSELNTGLFMACLQRGDVKGIFCGHEHLNDFQGEYCGITLAYDCCVGYNMSTHDDLRGGRVITLDEKSGTFTTKHIKLMDLLGKEAMRKEDYFEGGSIYCIRKLW